MGFKQQKLLFSVIISCALLKLSIQATIKILKLTGSSDFNVKSLLPVNWQQPLRFFINSIIQSIKSFAASFPLLYDFVTVFPITYR